MRNSHLSLFKTITLLMSSSLLFGCGGGGSNDNTSAVPNSNPSVTISGDNTVAEQQILNLTANATDTDGSIASISWSVKSGEGVTLTGENTSSVSFTAPEVTENTIVILEVLATDNEGATVTEEVSITITDNNIHPEVNISGETTIDGNTLVVLSAAATDADGSIADISWSVTSDPSASITLADADSENVSFIAPRVSEETDVTLEVAITDNEGATTTATHTITIGAIYRSAITGTWVFNDETPAITSLTFTHDNHFILMATNTDSDCGQAGYELGTYTWNDTIGTLSLSISEDTNGCIGIHDEQPLNVSYEVDDGQFTLIVTGDDMVLNQSDGSANLHRVISDTNPLIGAYVYPKTNFEQDYSMVIYPDANNYIMLFYIEDALDNDEHYLLSGTYSYDTATTLHNQLSQTIHYQGSDTSSPNTPEITIKPQGDILIAKNGDNAYAMSRTHRSTDQLFLTEENIIGSFSTPDSVVTFNSDKTATVTIVDSSETFSVSWYITFGQLFINGGEGDEAFTTVFSLTAITANQLEFDVANFDLIKREDGTETDLYEYYTETWIRD
jgi:hypothetical protein